jgi:hypothetical protein
MQKTFGPVVFHPDGTGDFEARCYYGRFDCTFRIGDVCTHGKPSRKLENLPATPDWCEMKASSIRDARKAAERDEQPRGADR